MPFEARLPALARLGLASQVFGCLGLLVLGSLAACSDSKSSAAKTDAGSTAADGGTCSAPGQASVGPADQHCGTHTQLTSEAACHPDAGALHDHHGGASDDAGAAPEIGAPMYGAQADDDDCKYHVSWTASPICENSDVYFTVELTAKGTSQALAGADTMPEILLSDTHPGAIDQSKTVETAAGTYRVGPVRFDAPGKWTVRFHFFGDCSDFSADSPHGHAAFYVDVP